MIDVNTFSEMVGSIIGKPDEATVAEMTLDSLLAYFACHGITFHVDETDMLKVRGKREFVTPVAQVIERHKRDLMMMAALKAVEIATTAGDMPLAEAWSERIAGWSDAL